MSRNQIFTKYLHDSQGRGEVPMHSHTNGQINYVGSGTMELLSRDTAWVVPQRRIVWIPPDMPHSVRAAKLSGSWKIMVPRSYASFLPKNISVLRTSTLLIAALESLPVMGDSISSLRLKPILQIIKQELLLAESESFGVRLPKSERMKKLSQTLLAHPEDPRQIDDWAKALGMSRRTFTRNFFTETGTSFGEWKKNLVLSKALTLLGEGLSVSTVADHLAYANPSAFIAAFRKKYGASPLRFMRD